MSSRYELLARIAIGGMASVYAGRARGAGGFARLVAIKRPHPFAVGDPKLREQLEQEARLASMIHHLNVVSVLDVEELDGELVLVLDYVEGCTLTEIVSKAEETAPPYDRIAFRVLLDAAAGLHAAHMLRAPDGSSLGVVHRDVSPQNVLIGLDGVGKIADFGIAKSIETGGDHTATGVFKGKLGYMPPEYLEARHFDARSDLYSLAVVAWEVFTRKRLYKGATELDTLKRAHAANAPLVSSVRPELAPLDAVIAKALSRIPSQRYASVLEFADALEACSAELGGVAARAEVGERVEKVAGDVLADRRRLLTSSDLRASAEFRIADRDAVGTASLGGSPASASPAEEESPVVVTGTAQRRARTTRSVVSVVAAALLGAAFASVVAVSVVTGRSERESAESPLSVDASAGPASVSASAPTALASSPATDPSPIASTVSVSSSSAPRSRSGRPPAHGSTDVPRRAPPNPYAHGGSSQPR